MTKDPDLESAYALSSQDDTKRLYADWAKSYDSDFAAGQGYLLPRHVVDLFLEQGGRGPVLDVGAGTGLVGEGLAAAGIGPLDGLDLSAEMLEVARDKAIYRDLIAADVTQPLTMSGYFGIVSAGTFTLGHVGPEGFPPLLAVAERGCLFVLSVNAIHFESAGFAAYLAEIETRITDLMLRDVRIYSDCADPSHRNDVARLISFRTV
ncbi:MAG: methyltransferase domain-containing protein [Pseudomonadota bacterium]